MASLNLQRNSEVFFSTVDIIGTTSGAASVAAAMTPANTWKLEVLAGFTVTSSSATQDITSLESGLTPEFPCGCAVLCCLMSRLEQSTGA